LLFCSFWQVFALFALFWAFWGQQGQVDEVVFSQKATKHAKGKSRYYYSLIIIRFTHTPNALRFISTTNANQPLLSNDITFAWLVVVYVVIIIQ